LEKRKEQRSARQDEERPPEFHRRMHKEFGWLGLGGEKVGLVGPEGWVGMINLEEDRWKGLCTEWVILNEGGWQRKRPDSRATPQGLDQRSKMEEVVPKMARLRGSDVGQSRRK